MFWLFEVRDSDGNDTTVYDVIVDADTLEAASDILWAHLEKVYPKDEHDGGFGTFHACDCACEHRKRVVCPRCRDTWECSHGGITTNEDAEPGFGPAAFDSPEAARAAGSRYHAAVYLPED